MSRRRDQRSSATGAHRARSVRGTTHYRRHEPPSESRRRREVYQRYEPHLDGLFTYCLSVMCDHDEAISALGEAIAVAERQRDRDRAPRDPAMHRAWLYSLARWACLRRFAERGGERSQSRPPASLSSPAATQRRRELRALAWPEAAGTTPGQREALELAVRHGLRPSEVALVLGLETEAASTLLQHAACEVERTRAALAVVENGGCPVVARLAADDRLLMGTALRRELVRHVDECFECRKVAEGAMAAVAWPGTAPAAASLTVLEAPRPTVHAAVHAVQRARCAHVPRFDRHGFPQHESERDARRERMRHRAVTTTVVATVMAAPLLALWAAYRGAPLVGEGQDRAPVSADDRGGPVGMDPYENAGQADRVPKSDEKRASDLRVQVKGDRDREGPTRGPAEGGGGHSSSPGGGDSGSPGEDQGDSARGRLKVDAQPSRDGGTLIYLTNVGDAPVDWTVTSDADWLYLNNAQGTLRPGERTAVRVVVNRGRQPAGHWEARIQVAPAGAVVTLEGQGRPSQPAPSPTRTTPPGSGGPAHQPGRGPGGSGPGHGHGHRR
ncbi:sigma-70 family RNA polymerase sigma factor [Streptomyces sp. NPDC005438]|uniref:BACON domain-containing protein n=1 Tax=Streptomyces sp. NPDC005438 TaxID=3156880 RepID=UPI0033A97749